MSARWSARAGLRIRRLGSAGPEDLAELAHTRTQFDNSAAFQALLGESWREQIEERGWNEDHPENAFGVQQRRWCAPPGSGGVSRTEELAEAASRAAIAEDEMPEMLILATSTPKRISAATAARVTARLGWACASIDVRAGGAGALAAWALAARALGEGCERILLVASECLSAYLSPTDLSSCLLFGDGAAAILLEYAPGHEGGLHSAHIGRSEYRGEAFTIGADLPPAAGEERWSFQRPDKSYTASLAQARQQNVLALKHELGHAPDSYLPYAVISTQVEEDAASLGMAADSTFSTLAQHGCIGAAGCLDALASEHSTAELHTGRKLAFTACGGGISTSRLVWKT